MVKRVGDLELDQDLSFQQREWKVERFTWGVGGVLLFACLLGLFGRGPLSGANAGSEDGPLWVEYERLVRHRAPTDLVFHIGLEAVHDGELHLQLEQRFADKVQIERIDPDPDRQIIGDGRITYVFLVSEGNEPPVITFDLEMESFGTLSTPVRIEGGPQVNINQFVYP